MLGLLGLETKAGRFGCRAEERVQTIWNTPCFVLLLQIPQRASKRQIDRMLRRAAALCRRRSVHTLVPPVVTAPFSGLEPLRTLLRPLGLSLVEPGPFLWALAEPLTMQLLQSTPPERRIVAIQGERMQREIARLTEQLAPLVRHVALSVPGDLGLREQLREACGLSVLEGRYGLEQAQVVLLCAAPKRRVVSVPGQGWLFYLGSGTPLVDTQRILVSGITLRRQQKEPLPPEWNALALLAALWDLGRISKEDLEIWQWT